MLTLTKSNEHQLYVQQTISEDVKNIWRYQKYLVFGDNKEL